MHRSRKDSTAGFYGTTQNGPYPSNGFAFKMTPTGAFSTFTYPCTQNYCTGGKPYAGVILASDGNYYGTSSTGGDGTYRTTRDPGGTVFQLNSQSGLSTIYNFCSQVACDDGYLPFSPLVQGTDGNFYGVTNVGGANKLGSVFMVTSGGTLTTLHSFASTEGNSPYWVTASMQRRERFDGTTLYGGTAANCGDSGGCGTIFKITSSGTLTTLYEFCQQSTCADGNQPAGSLIQGADGNLYGVTRYGGAHSTATESDYGTVFTITTSALDHSLQLLCIDELRRRQLRRNSAGD